MMPLHYPTENPSLAFDRDIELIRYAEELGFDEFFIGEHHSGAQRSSQIRTSGRYLNWNIQARTFKAAAALRSGLSKVQIAHPARSVEARR